MVRDRLRALRMLIIVLLLALSPAFGSGAVARRTLVVSLYPYIPERAAAALALKQGFERVHPDIILDVHFNNSYYSLKPQDHGLLYEDADIHEIDSALLDAFLAHRTLAPLGMPDLAAGFDPLARPAGERGGQLIAAPHWMCADFLIYRADQAQLAHVKSLADLTRILGPSHGLLMDLYGAETLSEVLLDMRVEDSADPASGVSLDASAPTEAETRQVRQMLALEPVGFGRDGDYDARGGFYARQFARRAGAAYVGYSETVNAALKETATSCRHEDDCVTARDVRVAPFPFGEHPASPGVWVDSFAIDGRVHGQTLADARAFIRYAVSLPAYRLLLIPEPDGIPRYLLPATRAAYADPAIAQAAPLYARFHAIIQGGVTLQGKNLTTGLRAAAMTLDAALPRAAAK